MHVTPLPKGAGRAIVSSMGNVAAALGAIYDDVQCKITIPGLGASAVRVAAFGGTEKVSTLFRYWVDVATSLEDVASLEAALGKDVVFELQRDGKFERGVHGILTEVAPDGAFVAKNWARTRLLIQPRLANLCYSGGFRIFQKETVKQIITKLVAPERIDVVWRLHPDPPKRDYRTQLNESDFAFLERLAADEGLTFFFESTGAGTKLVFTNNPKGFLAIEGTAAIGFFEVSGSTHNEHVRTIQRGQRIRTGAVEHRDYDFTNPRVPLVARFDTGGSTEANTTRREWRDYPGGFIDPDAEGKPRAQMRLEEFRTDAKVFEGTATTLRLVAGKKFTLSGHAQSAFNGDLIVTNVTVGGNVDGAFDEGGSGHSSTASASLTRFTAVPADVPVRPRRLPKPPSRLQTARVVGPADGDPNVDAFGRVNVQFMWDRDGQFDTNSSCWIRMATPNAHANEGFWTAHRVGSEVLVDFLDGDIDRPVVVGALFNGHEPQPYKQPGGQTRSTWKVRGIPGGAGYNEITFENRCSGNEQIILHAQKDLNETILNDHTESIGKDQSSTVGNDQTITVTKDRSLAVQNNESIDVTVNRTIHVGGDQKMTIDGNQTDSVGADRTTTVTGKDSTTISGDAKRIFMGDDELLVKGGRTMGVLGSEKIGVGGGSTMAVGGDESVTIVGGRTTSVGGDEGLTINKGRETSITNDDILGVGKKLGVSAGDECEIKVGDATLTITKDGNIVLKTGDSTLSLAKDGTVDLKGKNVTIEASSALNVKGDNVTVKGSKVGIN